MTTDPIPPGLHAAIVRAVLLHPNTPLGLPGLAEIIADAIWVAMNWRGETTTDDFTR